MSTGQRVSLNSVERASTEQRDGQTYWAYEHLSQVLGYAPPPSCCAGPGLRQFLTALQPAQSKCRAWHAPVLIV